jgi:hypothetical protein
VFFQVFDVEPVMFVHDWKAVIPVTVLKTGG